jgi:recombination protein RecT
MSKNTPKKVDLIKLAGVRIKQFQESGLRVPKNYSVDTALNTAALMIADVQDKNFRPALEVCTPESIKNAMIEMVVKGLNPMNHCSFKVMGGKLVLDENYQGQTMRSKRDGGVKDVVARAVFKGSLENFEYEIKDGIASITKHVEKLEDRSSPVVGAYATFTMADGTKRTEIMDMDEIEAAWTQRNIGKKSAKPDDLSKAHLKFAAEMSKKTVIRRGLKPILQSLDDKSLFYEQNTPGLIETEENVKQEIRDQDFEDIEFDEVVENEPQKEEVKEPEKVDKTEEVTGFDEVNEFDK